MPLSAPRIDWRPILLEALFVVLGVVLALAANEWRRSHLDRRDADTALQSIHAELVANRAAVLESEAYHGHLIDTLSTLSRGGPGSDTLSRAELPSRRLFERGFFRPATLLHTAWDAAAATDAVRHMRYGDVLHLAQIYERQERYRQQSEQIGQLIFSQLFTQGFDGLVRNYANLNTILATSWYRECQLLLAYEEVLNQLSTTHASAAQPTPERCRRIGAS